MTVVVVLQWQEEEEVGVVVAVIAAAAVVVARVVVVVLVLVRIEVVIVLVVKFLCPEKRRKIQTRIRYDKRVIQAQIRNQFLQKYTRKPPNKIQKILCFFCQIFCEIYQGWVTPITTPLGIDVLPCFSFDRQFNTSV